MKDQVKLYNPKEFPDAVEHVRRGTLAAVIGQWQYMVYLSQVRQGHCVILTDGPGCGTAEQAQLRTVSSTSSSNPLLRCCVGPQGKNAFTH
jgi:hypothetical protein